MIKNALQAADVETAAPEAAAPEQHIAPAPRVSIQAFCETVETAAAIQAAGEDRRLGKAHLKVQMGGVTAASEAYRNAPTPNVIVLDNAGKIVRHYHVGQQWIDQVAFLPGSKDVLAVCTMPGGKAGDRVEAFREFGGIDGLDDLEQLSSAGAFVGLQMADQVKSGI